MNAEIKQKWINGLRSEKYKEGKNALRDQNGYSAIGVLCDIVDPAGWKEVNKHRHGWHGFFFIAYDFLYTKTNIHRDILWSIKVMIAEGLRFADIAEFIEENIPSDES